MKTTTEVSTNPSMITETTITTTEVDPTGNINVEVIGFKTILIDTTKDKEVSQTSTRINDNINVITGIIGINENTEINVIKESKEPSVNQRTLERTNSESRAVTTTEIIITTTSGRRTVKKTVRRIKTIVDNTVEEEVVVAM